LGPTPKGIPRGPKVETIPKRGSAPANPGDEAPSRQQNHLNERGHSVVVLARGDVLAMEHRRAVCTGEGPELEGCLGAK